jgi:hypothetical protein
MCVRNSNGWIGVMCVDTTHHQQLDRNPTSPPDRVFVSFSELVHHGEYITLDNVIEC